MTVHQNRQKQAQRVLLAGLTVYWLAFVHIGWSNHGGTGLYLPYNPLSWSYIFLLCVLFWMIRSPHALITFSLKSTLFVAGAAFMSLPVFWSPTPESVSYALPRIAGLWAGVLVWLTLRQCHFSTLHKTFLLYCLACAGIIESMIVLLELYGPSTWLPAVWQQLLEKYGRYGVGVFQQANVTASFMATGLASSLFLLGLKEATISDTRMEMFRRGVLAVGVLTLTAALTAIYSRIGWLGGILAIAGIYCLLTCRRFHDKAHNQKWLILLPFIGVIAGLLLMKVSVTQAFQIHAGSNHQRLLTLYYTLRYISHHIILGYGAGTYEGYYQAYLASLPGGNPGLEVMEHPHNEFLYQYAEGGIIATIGILCWVVLYFDLWRKAKNIFQVGAMVIMLPILLHTQVEFPLYYSVPHCLALLTLLRLSDEEHTIRYAAADKRFYPRIASIAMFLLTFYCSLVSCQLYTTGALLDKFENGELTGADASHITDLHVPWVARLRYDQDLTLLKLVQFREDPNPDLLRQFTTENAKWLSVLASRDLYSNQISVLTYLNEHGQATYWQNVARRTLPWEDEFQPPA